MSWALFPPETRRGIAEQLGLLRHPVTGDCSCHANCGPVGRHCGVLLEIRALREPGGKEALQEAYRAAIHKAAEDGANGVDARNLPSTMQKFGIPWDAIAPLTHSPDNRATYQAARKFTMAFDVPPAGRPRLLVLMGPTGIGKSTAAAAVCRDHLRKNPPNEQSTGSGPVLIWENAGSLTQVSAFKDVDQQRVQAMRVVPLLVIDDIGLAATATGRSIVRDIAMQRYDAARTTVLTGTIRAHELVDMFGEALADRIQSPLTIRPNLWSEKSTRSKRNAA